MNKAYIIGNLTKDPELRYTGSGTPVCSLSVAVGRNYKGADGKQITDFFTVIAWRGLAESCAKYLSKGKKVAVVGELNNRSYEKDGEKRYVTEIKADEVEFLSPRSATEAAPPDMSGFTEIPDEDLPF